MVLLSAVSQAASTTSAVVLVARPHPTVTIRWRFPAVAQVEPMNDDSEPVAGHVTTTTTASSSPDTASNVRSSALFVPSVALRWTLATWLSASSYACISTPGEVVLARTTRCVPVFTSLNGSPTTCKDEATLPPWSNVTNRPPASSPDHAWLPTSPLPVWASRAT